MVLTQADDFPIHQTAEPIAFAGSDRNFYDRYFFNGYGPGGEDFFAVAFGIYPVANIADAHFSCLRDGLQHCVHASRILDMERMDLTVGPIRIEVIEPLKRLRVIIDHEGIVADLHFDGRHFPLQEPRFSYRVGPRLVADYTRLTQNGRWTGWIEIDGVRHVLPEGAVGTRDRSWGVRPVGGSSDVPVVPDAKAPAMIWRWAPSNFADRSSFFHINRDVDGELCATAAALVPDGAAPADMIHMNEAALSNDFIPGTRYAASARIEMTQADGGRFTLRYSPFQHFLMKGIGYFNPDWPHGGYKGPLVVERDSLTPSEADPLALPNLHIQALCHVEMTSGDGPAQRGIGVLEQIVLGPYAPFGFAGNFDSA